MVRLREEKRKSTEIKVAILEIHALGGETMEGLFCAVVLMLNLQLGTRPWHVTSTGIIQLSYESWLLDTCGAARRSG